MSARPGCVILTYHSIFEGTSPLKIAPRLFAEQMEWLKANARVAPLEEVVDCLTESKPLPARTVVLTFDDGFADFYTHAAPVLRRTRMPAIVFLPTAFCGGTNRWPGQPGWVEEQRLMSWDQLRELAEEGFSFGAHSVTHPDLCRTAEPALEREIAGSKSEIEQQTGHNVKFFCYPYGRSDERVRHAVSRHYRAACSTRTAMLAAGADLFALPRVDAHLVRHPAIFGNLFARPFPVYLGARRLVRELRGIETA
jgi:peptidoglycan/xylan/chitin deacetylase (PgdA/CDA1 family)